MSGWAFDVVAGLIFAVGDFALFATYLMQVAEYTGFLGYLINTYRQSGVSYRRGAALMQGAPATELVAHHSIRLRADATLDVQEAAPQPMPRVPLQRLDVQRLWQRLLALNTTCLIVSHRPYVLARADQVLVMEGGGW